MGRREGEGSEEIWGEVLMRAGEKTGSKASVMLGEKVGELKARVHFCFTNKKGRSRN